MMVANPTPNLAAMDIAGVQPVNGPVGLIFALKTSYTDKDGAPVMGILEFYERLIAIDRSFDE